MNLSLVDWLLERLGVVIFVLVFVVQIVRGLLRTRQEAPADEAKPDALEEQRRVREIQESIRRRIAERRGEKPATEPPPLVRRESAPPPEPNPETTQLPEPFGDPLRRVLQELERRARPEAPPPLPVPPPIVETRNAELERQEKLAQEIKSLEEARLLAKRRAAKAAAGAEAEAGSATGQRHAARGRTLDDLRDPESIRRAVVLREILGTPVGLR